MDTKEKFIKRSKEIGGADEYNDDVLYIPDNIQCYLKILNKAGYPSGQCNNTSISLEKNSIPKSKLYYLCRKLDVNISEVSYKDHQKC